MTTLASIPTKKQYNCLHKSLYASQKQLVRQNCAGDFGLYVFSRYIQNN